MVVRGKRLVIPLHDGCYERHEILYAGQGFAADDVPRLELSLEECESVLTHLPIIIDFVMRMRAEKK